jgi:serine/threonine-protein kinase HipA
MNPVPHAQGLKLNVSEADNLLDLDLARSVAHYFRVRKDDADRIIADFQAVVAQWPAITGSLQVPRREQERLAPAFRLAGAAGG